MTQWDEIRTLARDRSVAARDRAGGAGTAMALLGGAEGLTGVTREPLHAGDPLLDGGEAQFDPEAGVIWFNADAPPELVAFYQAHEYAHVWLDDGHTSCSATDIDAEASEERVPLGIQRVEGYGPQERRERQANVFARDFLLPSSALKQWYRHDRMDAAAIAAHVGVLEGMVLHQLARVLLTPEIVEQPVAGDDQNAGPFLDPSQTAAAQVQEGPLLLEAGPGTGKTRTLTGRVLHLLNQGVAPSAILALTFSNRAAEEIRERVGRVASTAAPQIWMGTFHAFGLELLRKFGSHLGLPSRLTVLDPADALFLLERSLPLLELDHYQNLYEPTTYLRDILAAISRAKDELVGPADYAALAERMRAGASTPEAEEAADKALEVARVYAFYQEHLDREQLLDFGDLIFRAVVLLRANPDIRSLVRRTYRHVLVDEYQDVNRASGVLLREIAGAGRGLWVVADARQSIYRFRGAAPVNVRLFPTDFPGATRKALARNYRSQPPVLDIFAALAPRMRATAGTAWTPWDPDRSVDGGRVLLEVAEDLDAEGEGLAREIERQRAAGIRFRDQAVLCRSHTNLARIAALLERRNVPVLYLGDLFERPEVRDLLSLLSLACEGDGRGLVRVARFTEYQIPLADVRVLLAVARDCEVAFPQALALARDAEDISQRGKEGIALLERHLDGLCYGTSAWSLLVHYLFNRSTYLHTLLDDESLSRQQQRWALYQFLQFAHEQLGALTEQSTDPKRAFLHYVRRLEIFGEEKQLRQVPAWADSLDAVRLLTVHASKGLEFRAVYLPVLGQGYFPARRQARHCPPPVGMLPTVEDDHDEEEECLFFVALSRARDVLCLSRARRYGAQNSNPSQLLSLIAHVLPAPPDGPVTWSSARTNVVPPLRTPPASLQPAPVFAAEALDGYIRCPRQFYYESVLRLSGKREDSAYVQFHQCVYRVLRWLQEQQVEGRVIEEAAAQLHLAGVWQDDGPVDHPYEAIYRRNAELMITRAVTRAARPWRQIARPMWEIPLARGRVRLVPDQVVTLDDGSQLVQRFRTGHPSPSELDKDIYALYQVAAAQAEPTASRAAQVVYLGSDEVQPVNLGARTMASRLGRYEAAITGILAGEFPAQPNDRICPRCPHYFICPLAEDN